MMVVACVGDIRFGAWGRTAVCGPDSAASEIWAFGESARPLGSGRDAQASGRGDATTLGTNVTRHRIVCRADGKRLRGVVEAGDTGICLRMPTREELVKLDRKRYQASAERQFQQRVAVSANPEARSPEKGDKGRNNLADKFERAVDLETGAVVAVQTMVAENGYRSHGTVSAVHARGLQSWQRDRDAQQPTGAKTL